jgi:hypothetical protein
VNYIVHQYADLRYGRDCTFFKRAGGVASPSRIRPASSLFANEALPEREEKRTLAPVQLPFLGLTLASWRAFSTLFARKCPSINEFLKTPI